MAPFLDQDRPRLQRNTEITVHDNRTHIKDVLHSEVVFLGDPPENEGYPHITPIGYETLNGTLPLINMRFTSGLRLLPAGERKPGQMLSLDRESSERLGIAIFFSTLEPAQSEFRVFGNTTLEVEQHVVLSCPKGHVAFVVHTIR